MSRRTQRPVNHGRYLPEQSLFQLTQLLLLLRVALTSPMNLNQTPLPALPKYPHLHLPFLLHHSPNHLPHQRPQALPWIQIDNPLRRNEREQLVQL
jgi:hypothetical protein